MSRFTDLALDLMQAFYDSPKPPVAAVAGTALADELSVTHDLTQRDIFRTRHAAGYQRLQAGDSVATERLAHRN